MLVTAIRGSDRVCGSSSGGAVCSEPSRQLHLNSSNGFNHRIIQPFTGSETERCRTRSLRFTLQTQIQPGERQPS